MNEKDQASVRERNLAVASRARLATAHRATVERDTEEPEFAIVFDFPERHDPLFAGWTREGSLGFATRLESAARFQTEEVAERHLRNNYLALRDYGVVVEVAE